MDMDEGGGEFPRQGRPQRDFQLSRIWEGGGSGGQRLPGNQTEAPLLSHRSPRVWRAKAGLSQWGWRMSEMLAKVVDCDACPAHTPYLPRHGCPVKCTLKSLARMEQDQVTLLYKLRKHKMALATGYLSKDQPSQAAQGDLPNDVVIYTIQEES